MREWGGVREGEASLKLCVRAMFLGGEVIRVFFSNFAIGRVSDFHLVSTSYIEQAGKQSKHVRRLVFPLGRGGWSLGGGTSIVKIHYVLHRLNPGQDPSSTVDLEKISP